MVDSYSTQCYTVITVEQHSTEYITQTLKGLMENGKIRKGNTEIRKMYECWQGGEVLRIVAVIGQVKELLEKEIIFDDNTTGNEDKWLIIAKGGDEIMEFTSLTEAKEFCRNNYIDKGW